MQLSEILEENSIKSISKKTNISEQNLEYIFASDFSELKKVKTLGFISILEREYKADLSPMREEALEYYVGNNEDNRITMGMPTVEEKKGTSKLFILIVLGVLGYASWYFFTQFDKKHLSELIPFIDEQTIEKFVGNSDEVKEVSIQETTSQEVVQKVEVSPKQRNILILPLEKLWFGLVNMETKEREHFSIDTPYTLEVTEKSWLVATSSASFSLVDADMTKDFNDAQEHYFKIDKEGITLLSKNEYVTLGGWSQW